MILKARRSRLNDRLGVVVVICYLIQSRQGLLKVPSFPIQDSFLPEFTVPASFQTIPMPSFVSRRDDVRA